MVAEGLAVGGFKILMLLTEGLWARLSLRPTPYRPLLPVALVLLVMLEVVILE
jgi:hypothetical protein